MISRIPSSPAPLLITQASSIFLPSSTKKSISDLSISTSTKTLIDILLLIVILLTTTRITMDCLEVSNQHQINTHINQTHPSSMSRISLRLTIAIRTRLTRIVQMRRRISLKTSLRLSFHIFSRTRTTWLRGCWGRWTVKGKFKGSWSSSEGRER